MERMNNLLGAGLIPGRVKGGEGSAPGEEALRPYDAWEPRTLETPRLLLRRLRMRDAKDLYAWTRDEEVARYVLWDAHRGIQDTRDYLRYMKSLYRRAMPASWGIVLRETGSVIGTIGVVAWNPDHRFAEVGYSLGRAWWHHGYAAEALERLLRFLMAGGKVHRVEAVCDVRNPASARVMEKCGMKPEGTLKGKIYNKGEYVDVLLYAKVKESGEPDE